jgi:hypothetical protein
MSNRAEVGSAFLADVLSRIPDDRRSAVQSVIDTSPELAQLIGEGVLRQQDYSSYMDRLKQVETQQTQWWQENQSLAEAGRKAKDAGFDPAKPVTTPALPEDVVRRGDVERTEAAHAEFSLTLATLASKHLHEFGEPVDFLEIARDPRVKQIGLLGVYEATVAPKREAKVKAKLDEEVKLRVEEGVRERMKQVGDPRFPTSRAIEPGSPLDVLEPQQGGPGVDDFVNEYQRLVTEGAGAR